MALLCLHTKLHLCRSNGVLVIRISAEATDIYRYYVDLLPHRTAVPYVKRHWCHSQRDCSHIPLS
jgi:hypothetical protein